MGKDGVERIVGVNEGFFAVEDGGIVGGAVVPLVSFKGGEIHPDAALEGGVGIGIEIGIEEITDFISGKVEFDQGCGINQMGNLLRYLRESRMG